MFVLKQPSYWDELSIRTKWVREMRKPYDFEFGPVTNPFSVCWLVLEGNRSVEIGSNTVRVSSGDLVFFHPNVRYRLLPEAKPCPEFHYLSLGCELMLIAFDLFSFYGFPAVYQLKAASKVELTTCWFSMIHQFQRLASHVTDDIHQSSSNLSAIYYLSMKASIYEWLSLLFTYMDKQTFNNLRRLDSRILEICSFINSHYNHSLSLHNLAEMTHLSPSHFSHIFVQTLGMPPMEYVRRMRMNKAKQKLIDSSASLRQIAEQTGYESQSHFSRAFRHAEGISPLQYRKKWSSS
jgi:AraC family transcriptional regulator of arabinose operon